MDNNTIILITGGTGYLGQAIVKAFLTTGAQVWVNYRQESKFERLKHVAGSQSQQLHGFPADLTSEESVKALFAEVTSRSGRVDVLVQAAGGFWMGGELSETPLPEFHRMIQMNLLTTFLVTRQGFSIMKKNGGGVIFTVASKTAEEFPPGMGAYSISKAAVIALTRTLANEGKPYGIRANVILPSIIDTLANRQAMPDADTEAWVKPEEIANTIVHLSQPGVTVNGSLIKMYGKL